MTASGVTFLVMSARRPVVPCETLADATSAGVELLAFTFQPTYIAALVDGVVRCVSLGPERGTSSSARSWTTTT